MRGTQTGSGEPLVSSGNGGQAVVVVRFPIGIFPANARKEDAQSLPKPLPPSPTSPTHIAAAFTGKPR